MGELINGRFVPSERDEILSTLISVAEEYWGEELNDDEHGVVRTLYAPVADFFAQMQQDIRLVLDSSQLEFAAGQALDFLVELIGLQRHPAIRAFGEVTFYRQEPAGVDYVIPGGTTVQTDSVDPLRYRTTEVVVLEEGEMEVTAPVEAVEPGVESNVGPNVISVLVDAIPGVSDVNNIGSISGGEDEETDEALRARAKDELNGGMKATPAAIINELKRVEGVKSVSLFINDSSEDNTDEGGLPSHHFEATVEGGADGEVAQMILDTKAVADGVYGGAHGDSVSYVANLPNGQPYTITFSRPTIYKVTLDAELLIDESKFSGEDFVRDSLVRYLGGTLSTGDEEDGELRVGDNVIRSQVQHALMDVPGVMDIVSLTIYDEAGNPVEDNVPVAPTEIATASALDNSLNITTVT